MLHKKEAKKGETKHEDEDEYIASVEVGKF
jgi:hypothetical protein